MLRNFKIVEKNGKVEKEIGKELKKFKVQTILILDHKKRSNRKIFHSSEKLIASDSDYEETFKSMHQSIMTKIKKHVYEDYMVLNDGDNK